METETEYSEKTETAPQTPICCKACGQMVARRNDKGACVVGDEHTFRNPAGYSFHVIVFREAEGCREVGTATSQASWFSGYAWRIAVCRQCETHLGWHFSGGDEASFYGLIVTRLRGL